MTIQDAAKDFSESFGANPWFQSVGIGSHQGHEAIFVYTKHKVSPAPTFIRDGWKGFPVVLKKIGKISPLGKS